MHGRSLHGNREISSLTVGSRTRRRPASGRRGAVADDVRAGEVRLTGSTDEVGEQRGFYPLRSRWREAVGSRGMLLRLARAERCVGPPVSPGAAQHTWGRPCDGCALPTRDRSRMREFRTYGSARGVPSDGHPYRDNRPVPVAGHRQLPGISSRRPRAGGDRKAVTRRRPQGDRHAQVGGPRSD